MFSGRWYLGTDDRDKTGQSTPTERKNWRSLPETETSVLGSIEQMRLGRNANIKIAVGG